MSKRSTVSDELLKETIDRHWEKQLAKLEFSLCCVKRESFFDDSPQSFLSRLLFLIEIRIILGLLIN